MSFNMDDVNIGGQLHVGTGVYPAIKEGKNKINGSAALEGPVVVGPPSTYGSTEATLMVGPLSNDDSDCPSASHALKVTGPGQAVYVKGNMYVSGTVDCLSTGRLEARHRTADSKPKLFDMEHPSTPGMRLAHACIEGPEVSVFYRGRCRNSKEIIFPSYWKDLVHINSISVQLQPVGAHQDIIVKRWDDEKVYLQSKGGMPIDCFYHIYAERKDVKPLVVEYTGETWEDRPEADHDYPNTTTG
jgi:hypothetical protein